MQTLKEHKSFGGTQGVYRHVSAATGTEMEVAVYVPPQAKAGRVPVLTYLSGLTCTWENVVTKGGFQAYAAQHGLIVVAPDTSPRGTDYPGEHESYDFGSGAGFYVDATEKPWAGAYRMYSYITEDLPALVATHFPGDVKRQGIFGHSMGGHGALVAALRNGERYRSVSAFAPIAAPSQCPWGQKAFDGYLGPDRLAWRQYDATELVARSGWPTEILIDQGTKDEFLEEQLKPELFRAACDQAGVKLNLRMQDGYDHSYYFIASFMGDHVAHHAKLLKA
ncbi:MAG TPA: S-formylglutathione hydrolase [Alphaproteobacteria bacterium]|nr:S-formylglutathione hydrolase [Alphaproteobacteria bacterium]